MKKSLLIVLLFLSGCSASDRSGFCTGTAIGVGALGGLNPFALPCIANSIVDIASRSGGAGSSDVPSDKTFQSFGTVSKDIAENAEIMNFVVESQYKYRAGKFGDATDENRKKGIGLYVSLPLDKRLIIYDSTSKFVVVYENEYTPDQITSRN